MSDFQAIERRVKDECRAAAKKKTDELVASIATQLGYNPSGMFGPADEFQEAVKPLRRVAQNRFAAMEFNRLWEQAEKAALDSIKKGMDVLSKGAQQ